MRLGLKLSSPSTGALRRIPRRTIGYLLVVVFFFLILHTGFPNITVDTTTLGLLALLIFVLLLPYAKSIRLWGAAVDLDTVEPAKEAVSRVAIPVTSVATQTRSVSRSGVWRSMLAEDVNVALAGLRIEIESRLRRISGAPVGEKFETLLQLIRQLQAQGTLTRDEAQAIRSVVDVCNQAVHAQQISAEAAQATADLGESMLQLLDYKLQASSVGTADR